MFDIVTNNNSFEDFALSNGFTYWYASDLASWLGHTEFTSFERVVQKAISACTYGGVPLEETILVDWKIEDGKKKKDYKLSRFGCYLVSMNADSRKPMVAKAQVYFARLADAVKEYLDHAENVERASIRNEIIDQEKSIAKTVKAAGITDSKSYAFFQNAGYRGLYNMNLSQLKKKKGIPENRSLLDFMGKHELAADFFRVAETEAKIISENIKGQTKLEEAAQQIGQQVRKVMQSQGTNPEDLPIAEDIKNVKATLKKASNKLKD